MSITPHPADTVLSVRDLVIDFATHDEPVRAVRGVGFELAVGESVALVGESGSGKSVTSRALLGLVDAPGRVSGSIEVLGRDVTRLSEREWREVRGTDIAMVFQDSLDSLNPVYTVGSQLSEILRVRLGRTRRQAREEAVSLLEKVEIPRAAERYSDYPHQFSGGMRQRICIAMALSLEPRILIADEPTTALDARVQRGILQLFRTAQRERGTAVLFITHDLGVANVVADKIAVMYEGAIVEFGDIEEVFARPAHAYTRSLLDSYPGAIDDWRDLKPIRTDPVTESTSIPTQSATAPRRRALFTRKGRHDVR